jgi:hypothetical protein
MGAQHAQGEWFAAKPAKFHSAWPLAERYEALIRVFNDPAPYAKRLVARLNAAPHRARTDAPAHSPPRTTKR